MIRLGSCFTGIGAWESAFKRLGIKYDLKWYFEIDKYASCSYAAIHDENENKNHWDITKAIPNKLEDIDILVYSPPCQAFSVAGKQLGTRDPRGMMFYHTLPIIQTKKPKICMMENVKGLVTGKFKELFNDMLSELNDVGYNNYYKVLNSKDYGIPQNRERVFVISIRKDIDKSEFEFPQPFDNGLRLKDILEDEVEEKYYLSDEYLERFKDSLNNKELQHKIPKTGAYEVIGTTVNPKAKGTNSRHWVYSTDKLISTIDATTYKQPKQILDTNAINQIVNIVDTGNFKNPQRGRIYSPDGISPALNTVGGGGLEPKILIKYKIRKLTPLECWRLQGFTDEEYWKARKSLEHKFYKNKDRSNSQMYKQAGNSITVNVLVEIYKKIFIQEGVLFE